MDKKKKIIQNSIEGKNEAKIQEENFVKKLGGIYYVAIKVDDLEQALSLCIEYNKQNNLKVHLHNLTYKLKKNKIPTLLVDKEQKNGKYFLNKGRKVFKEDIDNEEIRNLKFINKMEIINKKRKRNKK